MVTVPYSVSVKKFSKILKGQEGVFPSVAASHGAYTAHSKAGLEVFLLSLVL